MVNMPRNVFNLLFGKMGFIPMMCVMQKTLPPKVFASLAFNMFCYLFNWNDNYWLPSRYANRPISLRNFSESLNILCTHRGHSPANYWPTGLTSFALDVCIHFRYISEIPFYLDCVQQREGSESHVQFQPSSIQCPLALFYSTEDSLVDAEKLLEILAEKGISSHCVTKLNGYEHMDLIWANDAPEKVFEPLVKILKAGNAINSAL